MSDPTAQQDPPAPPEGMRFDPATQKLVPIDEPTSDVAEERRDRERSFADYGLARQPHRDSAGQLLPHGVSVRRDAEAKSKEDGRERRVDELPHADCPGELEYRGDIVEDGPTHWFGSKYWRNVYCPICQPNPLDQPIGCVATQEKLDKVATGGSSKSGKSSSGGQTADAIDW